MTHFIRHLYIKLKFPKDIISYKLSMMIFLKEQDHIVFIEPDDEKKNSAAYHPQGVEDDFVHVTALQLCQHRHQGYIQEDPNSCCKKPGGKGSMGADEKTNHQSNEGKDG